MFVILSPQTFGDHHMLVVSQSSPINSTVEFVYGEDRSITNLLIEKNLESCQIKLKILFKDRMPLKKDKSYKSRLRLTVWN